LDLSRIMELLPDFINAGHCVEIRGRSGIGKSDQLREFAWDWGKKLGHAVGVGSHYFGTYSYIDVAGVIMPRTTVITRPDGTQHEQFTSEWSAPAWLRADPGQEHKWLNDFERAILILEEYDKANIEVKKASAPLIKDGGFGDFYLKKGTGRILLTNHADDGRQGSTKDFDFGINRRFILHGTQSVQGWMHYADRNNIHFMFKSFAQAKPEIVFASELPKEQGPFITPRSLTLLENVAVRGLITAEGHITDPDAFIEVAASIIGAPAARDLVTYFKFKEDVPLWEDIAKSPGTAKLPENAGAQIMACHLCAHNADPRSMEAAVTYVRRIRKEFHLTFAKAAAKRNFRLVSTPAFMKWTAQDPALVALINALGGK